MNDDCPSEPWKFADATETLCSLARTARLFYSPAKRALLYDPTRALFIGNMDLYWPRMHGLLQKLLREPVLGRHVKRLDSFPEYWYLLEYGGASDLELANWILTLGLLCPSIFSLAVPVTLPDNSAAAPAFRDLAKRSNIHHLTLSLAHEEDILHDSRILHKCQELLASLDLSRCDSLELPPLEFDDADVPDCPPVSIPTKSLILHDCFEEVGLAGLALGRYFDLAHVRSVEFRPSAPEGMDLSTLDACSPELDELTICGAAYLSPLFSWPPLALPRFPRLTQLTLGKFDLTLRDLRDIVNRYPLLRVLNFTYSIWSAYDISPRVWSECLRALSHLRTLRTGTIHCDSTRACKRLRQAITEYCDRNGISVICTVVFLISSSDSLSSVNTGTELSDRTRLCACRDDLERDFEEQQGRSEDDDEDSAVSEWLRGVSVADPDVPDYERFNRDGIPWHWVFDPRGRPTAVPDDLAFYPPTAFADEAELSDDEDDVGTEASLEYLAPLPDVPRLKDGYEAHDDDQDGDGFGPEPWLTWSEFCDFALADAAWARFDMDDEDEEMGSSEGEISQEEGCEGEDDELVSEDGLLLRFR